MPLRQARSQRAYDPLRSEELFQRYVRDNAAECASPGDRLLDNCSLIGEAEKALMIESLVRAGRAQEKEEESNLREKLGAGKEAQQEAIKIAPAPPKSS